MTGEQIIAQAIAKRTSAGLRLAFIVPDREDVFVCYPKDETTKQRWIEQGQAKGWKLAH